MKIEELNIEVEDLSDFESEASDIMDDLCMALQEQDGMTRQAREDEYMPEHFAFIWTDKATRLIKNEENRLYAIGAKYFPNEDIDIVTSMYQEE